MLVRDLMTKDVFTLNPDHPISLAKDMMDWQRIRHVPVVDKDDTLVGLLTHRDILAAAISTLADISSKQQHALDKKIRVSAIMQSHVATVDPETRLTEAASLMFNGKFGCLPVVERGRLVGIVTEADFLKLAWRSGAFD